MSRTVLHVLLVAVVVVGMVAPAAAAPAGTTGSAAVGSAAPAAMAQANNSTNGTNVTVGQQLSTVVSVSSDEVQSDFERTEFEASLEDADEERRAELIAERAEELRETAVDIREAYIEATEAYKEGELSKSEYAQRIATLNARATNLLDSYEQLQRYAANVSALELRAAGFEKAQLAGSMDRLDNVTGAGATALLKQFTGESTGEFEVEAENGLSVDVESEDGERSREIERPRDDDRNMTVNQSAALDAARAALTAPENGSWVLTSASVQEEKGAYSFSFALRQAPGTTGEAEVSVDGSSGEVYSLEEEIEPRDEAAEDEADEETEDEADEEAEDGELALVVAEGTPAPNATVTVKALADGAAAPNVTVFLDGEAVGTTGADGTVTVTLPASEETKLTAETDAGEAELEFEFEREEEDELFGNLQVNSSLANGTVTVNVRYNGTAVANATVYANDQMVGTTDDSGTVSFAIDADATDELELEVVRGAFEAEIDYTVQNGTLTMTEAAHEGDGDKTEAEEETADDEGETETDEEGSDEAETETDEEESEDEETET
ncbi:MAG: hypothetical protein ABEH90_09965, partial [Halolamina sp.]